MVKIPQEVKWSASRFPRLDVSDDSLSAVRHVDMLDRDFLFTTRPVLSKGLDLGREGPC